VQSAIGRVALKKVPGWVTTRRQYAAMLTARLSQIGALRIPLPQSHCYHAYYKYYAFVRPDRLRPGWDRDRIMKSIAEQGVPCLVGSCSEIYLEKAFLPERRKTARLPVAKELGETSLMFLVHPTLTVADIEYTCQVVENVMADATQPRFLPYSTNTAAKAASNSR
jgi:dTDP-4-amino-4,6-dideoxygalactose transaminase